MRYYLFRHLSSLFWRAYRWSMGHQGFDNPHTVEITFGPLDMGAYTDALAKDISWGCSDRDPRACVELVIRQQQVGPAEAHWLLAIPGCESSWNADAVSGPNVGLYQWNESTWRSLPGWLSRHSPFSAYWSARAAAWGYAHLERGKWEWECTALLGLG